MASTALSKAGSASSPAINTAFQAVGCGREFGGASAVAHATSRKQRDKARRRAMATSDRVRGATDGNHLAAIVAQTIGFRSPRALVRRGRRPVGTRRSRLSRPRHLRRLQRLRLALLHGLHVEAVNQFLE